MRTKPDLQGYMRITHAGKEKKAHVVIAERVLGKPLPPGAMVHHVNEDKADNRNENLVICPNQAYHSLIHQRMRAMNACGNHDWLPCDMCSSYDDPKNLAHSGRRHYHAACAAAYQKKLWQQKKEKNVNPD